MTLRTLSAAILFGTIATLTPLALAQTVITESAGTISSFSPESLVITSQTGPATYVVSKEVTYVDDAGAPVSIEVVKSGAPVTVHYVKEADRVVAQRVIVHRKAASSTVVTRPATVITTRPAPVVEERTTVVTPAPAPAPKLIERTTTTTTTTNSTK